MGASVRLLILSDIHANLTALEAALSALEGRWDRVVCLGDLVGYGPDPNEVIDHVKKISSTTIRGNHDKAGSGIDSADDFNPVARKAALWTREQLTEANTEYLRQLPAGPVGVDGVTLLHGALRNEDEYVFAPAQALEGLLESPTPVTLFGHTHYQGGFSFRDNNLQVVHPKPGPGKAFAALQLDKDTRYLLNPGSIGQPRDGDPRAACAVADLEHSVVEFWRVPYDIDSVQKRMLGAGLPEPLALRLALGR